MVNWYDTCPWKASWIPDMALAVFSQNCSRVVYKERIWMIKVCGILKTYYDEGVTDSYLVGAEGV